MNTLVPRSWFQNTNHLGKELIFPGEMTDSRLETQNVQGEPGTYYVRKQKKGPENDKYMSKGQSSKHEGPNWDNQDNWGIFLIEKNLNF